MRNVDFIDLERISFREAWQLQSAIQKRRIEEKLNGREHNTSEQRSNDVLLFAEHPHVFTLGKSGDVRHLLKTDEELKALDAEFVKIDRGGDITYHGPGQIVAYPILDLDHYFTDIHKYLRFLEETVIRTCLDFGITAERSEGLTGVWVGDKKIAAFGIRCSRWVTMHGLALNVKPSLEYFNYIVPCGIANKNVTSLNDLLRRDIEMEAVKSRLKNNFCKVFNVTLREVKSLPESGLTAAADHLPKNSVGKSA